MGLVLAAFLAFHSPARAAPGVCAPAPAEAVTVLPKPLADWGALVCTPYGYVITARDGWVWTEPTTIAPVFIPAQMVRTAPQQIGAAAFFKKIDLAPASDAAFDTARQVAFAGFDPAESRRFRGYRLDLLSFDDKSLSLYFFDDGHSRWGIWCPGDACDRSTLFMLIKGPRRRPQP